MPLEAPDLDVRTFEQLVQAARLRIPRYTPEWTDFNDSDPGMTLVQLFAWFTETLLYEMNRIPDRNYIKLLQLLNIELRPAQPAVAHLTFFPQAGADVQPVARGTQITAQPADSGLPLIFEIQAGLDLVRLPLAEVQVFDGAVYSSQAAANATAGSSFRPLGWIPQVNNALYLGFAQTDPPASAPLFPPQLRLRVFKPLDVVAGRPQQCVVNGIPGRAPVQLVWEYQPANSTRWRQLSVREDETLAFTREGYILLEGPRDIAPTRIGRNQEQAFFWLRCRLDSGSYPAGQEPEIDLIRPNVAPAINLATVREEVLGISEGIPDQIFTLDRKPVASESLELYTDVDGDERLHWERRPDLLASSGDDQHYTLNANTGEVRFGDGRRGEIPVASAAVIARSYRYGGGSRGNVAADMINSPTTNLRGIERVTNERPAAGGGDEQAVEDLLDEAPGFLRTRNRAVTAADFTALAQQAGGVANAVAIAQAHPEHPGVAVPGAVTVSIVPDSDDRPPVPSPDLIATVCGYLNERRLLTSEVFVKQPQYIEINVEALVIANPYASLATVSEAVEQRINEYLSPLRQVVVAEAGPAGQPRQIERRPGWAFGKDLYPTNLHSEISQVADVVAVRWLQLIVAGKPHDSLQQPVRVPPDGLVWGNNHTINVVPERDE